MSSPSSKIAGIAKRWTPALIQARGFTPVSNYFLESYSTLQPKISALEAMFIVHLISFKWDEEAPFPSFKKIAAHMGVSASAARSYARSLERKNYLKREARSGDTTIFLLQPLFEKLEYRLSCATYITPRIKDESDMPPEEGELF